VNVNNVTVAGNLTRDPELRYTTKGEPVTEASIAINRRWTVNGEQKESTTYVGLVIWGKRGEAFAKYLKKGQPVYCEGELENNTWEDKEGKRQTKTKIKVLEWQFVERREGAPAPRQAERPSATATTQAPVPAPAGEEDPNADVPF
jgi:single-strand DNA-binding protein